MFKCKTCENSAICFCSCSSVFICFSHLKNHIRSQCKSKHLIYSACRDSLSLRHGNIKFKSTKLAIKLLKQAYGLTVKIPKESITSTIESPDGKFLIASSTARTIQIWDINAKALSFMIKVRESFAISLTMTVDSKYLIAGLKSCKIKFFRLPETTEEFELNGHEGPITSLLVSFDGKFLVSSSEDATIRIWSLQDRVQTNLLKGHEVAVNCIALSNDCKILASGDFYGVIILWDFDKKEIQSYFRKINASIKCLGFFSNNQSIVISLLYSSTLYTLYIPNQSIGVITTEGNSICKLIKCKNNLLGILCDSHLEVWDLDTITLKKVINNAKYNFAFSNSIEDQIYYFDSYNLIRISYLSSNYTSKDSFEVHTNQIDHVMFSDNLKFAVTLTANEKMLIWDLEKRKLKDVFKFEYDPRLSYVKYNYSDFSEDCTTLATAVTGHSLMKIYIWKLDYYSRLSNSNAIYSNFSEDCMILNKALTGHSPIDIFIWNTEEQRLYIRPAIEISNMVSYTEKKSVFEPIIEIPHLKNFRISKSNRYLIMALQKNVYQILKLS